MKKVKYFILSVFLASLTITSCEDAYEIEPIGILDDEATFRTVNDAELFMNGIYPLLDNRNHLYFTALFTDEVAPAPEYQGTGREEHNFILNSTSTYPSAIWLQGHQIVNRVNRLLNGVQYIEVEEGEEEALNNIIAQARTLRAYAYLTLTSYFSPDMTDNNALGAMLFTSVPLSNETFPRSTNGEVYALIEEDLSYAMSNLTDGNEFIYVSKPFAEGLLARMYAYRGQYQLARQHAQNVINNYGISLTPAQPFDLSNFYHVSNTTNPYRQVWSDNPVGATVQRENLFSLQNLVNGTGFSFVGLFYFNQTRLVGDPIWGMGLNLYSKLNEMPNDIRRYAFVDPSSDESINAIMIDKYPGVSGSALTNNLKIMRLSEMYFILAEAAVSEGNLDMAENYIFQLRQARTIEGEAPMPSYANVTAGWAGVLDERRKELCFEGHRYVDLKRLGVLANVSIDRNILDNEQSNQPTTISNTDYRFTMPIPFDEIRVNPEIQQNPGY